jgi:hypothetical protein
MNQLRQTSGINLGKVQNQSSLESISTDLHNQSRQWHAPESNSEVDIDPTDILETLMIAKDPKLFCCCQWIFDVFVVSSSAVLYEII